MLKKCIGAAILVGMCLMLVSAAEKRDTSSITQMTASRQLINTAFARQSSIRPVKSSTWSRIKDLFM